MVQNVNHTPMTWAKGVGFQTNTKIFLIKMERHWCTENGRHSFLSLPFHLSLGINAEMTRHAKTAPAPCLNKPRTVRKLRGRTERKGCWDVTLAGGPAGLLFSWEVIRSQTASCGISCVTVTVAHFSWEDSSPGCSSRCSGSRSCRTVVAGKESEQTGNKIHRTSQSTHRNPFMESGHLFEPQITYFIQFFCTSRKPT